MMKRKIKVDGSEKIKRPRIDDFEYANKLLNSPQFMEMMKDQGKHSGDTTNDYIGNQLLDKAKKANYPNIDEIIYLFKVGRVVNDILARKMEQGDYLFNSIDHQCVKIGDDSMRQSNMDKDCNPESISEFHSGTYMINVFVCIYGKVHICEPGRCRSGQEVGHHRSTICRVSGFKTKGFSVFDRDNKDTYGSHAITTGVTSIKNKKFHEMNDKSEIVQQVSLVDYLAPFGANDFTVTELKKYLTIQQKMISEKLENGNYYLRVLKKERVKRSVPRGNRKKKTYSTGGALRRNRRMKNPEKHHNIGFIQPRLSTKTPSREHRRRLKIELFSIVIASLKKNPPRMTGPFPKNIDYWYLNFLMKEPFQSIIALDKDCELSLKANRGREMFSFNKIHRTVFAEGIKIVKALCPGLYRLKIETENILKICKQKKKKLTSIIEKNHKFGIMSNYYELEGYASFDYQNYKQILTETISDDEVIDCVILMVWFWDKCMESPYMKKQGVQCMNVTNHCIAILYNMRNGLQINDHTLIPKNNKFSQRGYLTDLNSINNYGFTRKNHSTGSKLLSACINSLIKTVPIHKIKPFGKNKY